MVVDDTSTEYPYATHGSIWIYAQFNIMTYLYFKDGKLKVKK